MLINRDYQDVTAEPITDDIAIRWVIGRPEGAPNFAMRVIEFAPGAVFEPHHHPYEHEIFVLAGEGVLQFGEQKCPMKTGRAIYVPPDVIHGYQNTGNETLRFICVIPHPEN